MIERRDSGASPVLRPWPLFRIPPQSVAYLILIDIVATGWLAGLCLRGNDRWSSWGLLALMTALAIGFEESARRAATLKLRLTVGIKRDMTSVWCVAGAVTLPSLQAGLLVSIVLLYVWVRQQRPVGEVAYRKVFNWAAALVGCLTAAAAYDATSAPFERLPFQLSTTLAVVLVIVVHAVTNRVLVTVAALTLGMRGRDLIGSFDDNIMELATLCLGGLVAAAATYEPWSAVFVVVPMLALQRGALVRQLETAAATDSKTGLLNAIAWEQLAIREVGRAARERYAVSVLIIDIDRFKQVNDRFGHLIGDDVLVGIGRAIRSALRDYDGLGRFGGEEFVAVLPEAGEDVGIVIAERIRARISQLSVGDLVDDLAEVDEHALSVSIGVACFPIDGADLAELLHRADRALYEAKDSGRNRVQLARRGGAGDETTVVA